MDEARIADIARSCPAVNWKKHRFGVGLTLANKQHISARFDLPVDGQEVFRFTPTLVEAKFGDAILVGREGRLSPEGYTEICEAISDVLNRKMDIVIKDVREQLIIVAGILQALLDEKWLAAYILITHLGDRLVTYAGELWLYEWPEWVTKVETFLGMKLSDEDKETLRRLL